MQHTWDMKFMVRMINANRSMCLRLQVVLALLCMIPAMLYAQDMQTDESALFSDTSSVIDSTLTVNTAASKQLSEKTTDLSGSITSANIANANRNWFGSYNSSDVQLSSYMVANLMLDVRLPQGTKAFANLETEYVPSGSSVIVGLRELFVDVNLHKHVFLRFGKQVLQWGPCNLWNPTDLINVEKKLFIQKIGYREGAYGIKAHIPFGTVCNIYGFLDTKSSGAPDSLALAGKAEFLVGGTEMALSMWTKKHRVPVFGYDISTRTMGIDITGEASISKGSNTNSMFEDNGMLYLKKSNDYQTRVSVDFGHDFDLFSVSKGLSVIASFYYNQAGYDKDLFSDAKLYTYRDTVFISDSSGTGTAMPAGTKALFLTGHSLYEQNNSGKYYVALQTTINRLFLNSLTGYVKIIDNIPQSSMIISTGINYTSLHEFYAGLMVNGYIGNKNTEYTFQNQAMQIQFTAGLTF
jgi:hypothetical protein